MRKIVAIGGGELRLGETKKIDQYIVELTGKENPSFLFIPTASHDAEGYIETAIKQFGELGCKVQALCLFSTDKTAEEIRDTILSSDIIYVGGGDTETMMKKWSEFHVDCYLREAYEKGIVLSGLSAGSICWFIAGHSDSEFFDESNKNPQYRWVQGLGLIPYLHCPHYDEQERGSFDEFMRGQAAEGIALENCVALVSLNGHLSIIKANAEKKAYKISYRNGQIFKNELNAI